MIRSLTILLVFVTAVSTAQNLVPNARFDDYVYCPVGINQSTLEILKDWSQVGSGTPDYFHSCGTDMGVPRNIFGKREAAAGDGYAGLVAFSPSKRNYREYLQIKLTSPLRTGEWYCIEMKVALADNALYTCDGLGMALSQFPYRKQGHTHLPIEPVLENPAGHVLYFYPDWIHLSTSFIAEGQEEYLIIGNFLADEMMQVKTRNVEVTRGKPVHHAYYFIDDVSIRLARGPDDCDNTVVVLKNAVENTELKDMDYRAVRLQSILFEFDTEQITPEAEEVLSQVLLVLKRNPYYEVEVAGHTDIVGREGYNLGLSRRRSEQVIHYLNSRGISSKRLRINYHGSAQPVTTNETAAGRQQNRRVEFLIVEKQYGDFGE